MIRMLSAIVTCACLTVGIAEAASGTVKIELNKLEAQGASCQAYMVLQNETDAAFEVFSLDLVLFGTDGIIAKRLAVNMAPMRAGRTSVKVFSVKELTCNAIGRVLINGVLKCESGGTPRSDCPDLISAASRNAVELLN